MTSELPPFRCAVRHDGVGKDVVRRRTCRWYKDELTYTISKTLSLSGSCRKTRALLREGFDVYTSLTGITFQPVPPKARADIRVGWGRGPRWGFDGTGGILAWAQLPCNPARGVSIKFDQDEQWVFDVHADGIYTRAVWLHELGHAMGLTHSDDPADLMYPEYRTEIIEPQRGDRIRLLAMYDQIRNTG